MDFTWIGIALILLGFYSLWKHNRRLCIFFFLALLFLGPAFFFYASFPLVNRFTLGTYERFLLPSYVLLAVLCGIGLSGLADGVRFVLKQRRFAHLVPLIFVVGFFVMMILPISRLGVTIWRFYGLPADRTADNLGKDILSPLPKDSILLLDRDTTLFSTQYVRYALSYRPDVIVIHTNRLRLPDYEIILHAEFPDITFPASGSATEYLVTSQQPKRRIFANSPINVGSGWSWVPYGLTFELVAQKDLPAAEDTYSENLRVWNTLHDPMRGILSRYDHLLLYDVRDVYAGARIEFGNMLFRAGMFDAAHVQYRAAILLGGDAVADAYKYDGRIQLMQKNCDAALQAFNDSARTSIVPDKYITFYQGITYRDCVGDAARAQELFDAYEAENKQNQTPLEKL